jgi:two-component system cell cycle sensor histidine kinase/response regulator CckA
VNGAAGSTRRWADGIWVGAAVAASLVLLWMVTRQPVLVAGFAGGLLALGALALVLARRPAPAVEPEPAMPDWTVTVAAIEREDMAVAVTDRATRLVCANRCYEEWFGGADAPPRLPVDAASHELLTNAARGAWRDGEARVELIGGNGDKPDRCWTGEVARAGRSEGYLVWRFSLIEQADPVAELAERIEGNYGRVLNRAGIAAAIVDPEGVIRAASQGFARRAAGDAQADVGGEQIVSFLSEDERGRISWLREGDDGLPITLFYLPIDDPDTDGEPDPASTFALILLADAEAGIGAGGETIAAAPNLEQLLARLPLGLAMADRDGRLLFANAAFMRAAGREGAKPPIYPTDLVIQEDKRVLSEAVRRHAQGPVATGDVAVRLINQGEDPVSLSLSGVRGLGDAAVLLGLTDTTEESRLKRQVAQATKMQAVGQLAGGVAHDFNNVLTAILGTCDLMLMRHTPGDSDYDDIQQIRANSNRAASLTRQLLAFSRQQTLRPAVLQLPDVVSEVSQMLKRLIGEKIQLVVEHDRDLGPVRADPGQLEQVIVNLAVNARDAMQGRGDGSGRLTLATRRITPADVRALDNEIMPIGEYSALVVEDTGDGIPPDIIGKIFEPFFTTKEQGRGGNLGGTGLGLSTVYGFVKQSGGFIFADSEPGKGTRFTVYLPVHHVAPGEAVAGQAGAKPSEWAGGGQILLVEDEDPVRMVAERALTRRGYEVTCASDGEEGLDLVRMGRSYDLVVSDVVMPSMDGPAMANEIRKLVPDMPILFMSGYAEEQLRKEIGLEGTYFLPKPFSVQQLSDKVGEVLAAER